MTKIRVVRGDATKVDADAVIVNLFKGVVKPGGATGAIDAALGGAVSELIRLGDFKGKLGEATVLPAHGKIAAKRVIVIGLGEKKSFDLDAARKAGARGAVVARDRGCATAATIVHGAGIGGLDAARAAHALVEGALLGLYEYKEYKSKPKDDDEPARELKDLIIVETDAKKLPKIVEAARQAEALARVTNDVRTWVNRPSLDKPPQVLANVAQSWAKKHGLKATILNKADLERLKMGGVLGVGAGSQHPPKLVILEKPAKTKKAKTVLLVGKGITFDSGGISIKPAQGMDQMRHDMAGAAAVLGAICAASDRRVSHRVVALLPLAENMPSGSAIRPGDILRAYDGQTIEVLNTDAEGRLVLADALGYGIEKYKPDYVIDVATLTGAVKVALGTIMTGLFSNDDGLAKALTEAGKRVGDDLWRLPVNAEFARHVKSDVADVKNTGTNFGGSVTAAAFLSHFVGKAKWAHLDIAGTCWTEKSGGDLRQDYHAKGATGVGVRLLAEYLRSLR